MKGRIFENDEQLVNILEPLGKLANLPEDEFAKFLNEMLTNDAIVGTERIVQGGKMLISEGVKILNSFRGKTLDLDDRSGDDIIDQIQKDGDYLDLIKLASSLFNDIGLNRGEFELSKFSDMVVSMFPDLIFSYSFQGRRFLIRSDYSDLKKDELFLGYLNLKEVTIFNYIGAFDQNRSEILHISNYLKTGQIPGSYSSNLQKLLKEIYLDLVSLTTDVDVLMARGLFVHLIPLERLVEYFSKHQESKNDIDVLLRACLKSYNPELSKDKVFEAGRLFLESRFDQVAEGLST